MDNVTAATGNRAFGLLPADDIYIIRTSEAPVALVEVGFMTNRQESLTIWPMQTIRNRQRRVYTMQSCRPLMRATNCIWKLSE